MNTTQRVESILKFVPDTRSSDKKLLMTYWEKQGLILTPEQKRKFMDCTTAESITRARRKLKTEYPATKEVEEQRYNLFEQYKHNLGRV